jgi:hypothetical protein
LLRENDYHVHSWPEISYGKHWLFMRMRIGIKKLELEKKVSKEKKQYPTIKFGPNDLR